jgi:glutaminyl-peptide cyclotransferase
LIIIGHIRSAVMAVPETDTMRLFFLIIIISMSIACSGSANNANSAPPKKDEKVPTYTYQIVKTYPHDPGAFTQGLVFLNGVFYEGTGGRRGDSFHSSLRKVEIDTGKVLQKTDLAPEYFGEGITILNGKIYQLTWQENKAFVYDVNDFKLLQQFDYSTEGWGITNDGTNLFMSDGSHLIRVMNPENFKEIRNIPVLDERGKPIMELNELEYVKGEIWANVWQKSWIVRIDPTSGKLLGRIDLTKLAEEQMNASFNNVLNGIAYDAATDRIFVTGKLWKQLFEIKVVPAGVAN